MVNKWRAFRRSVKVYMCANGGIGRHARFRFWCRKAYRFKSCYPHQSRASTRNSRSGLYSLSMILCSRLQLVSFLQRKPISERVTLVPIFYFIKNQSPAPLFLLFRKKSRSARLFACKRAHNGSQSLPTFCEFERVQLPPPKIPKYLFYVAQTKPKRIPKGGCALALVEKQSLNGRAG